MRLSNSLYIRLTDRWADSSSPSSVLIYDTFTDADGPLLPHAPDINVPGNSWTQRSAGDGTIVSNQLEVVTGQVAIDSGVSDHKGYLTGVSNTANFLFRLIDFNNNWFLQASSGNLRLQRRTAGAAVIIDSTTCSASRPIDMEITANGTSISGAAGGGTVSTTSSDHLAGSSLGAGANSITTTYDDLTVETI